MRRFRVASRLRALQAHYIRPPGDPMRPPRVIANGFSRVCPFVQ